MKIYTPIKLCDYGRGWEKVVLFEDYNNLLNAIDNLLDKYNNGEQLLPAIEKIEDIVNNDRRFEI